MIERLRVESGKPTMRVPPNPPFDFTVMVAFPAAASPTPAQVTVIFRSSRTCVVPVIDVPLYVALTPVNPLWRTVMSSVVFRATVGLDRLDSTTD